MKQKMIKKVTRVLGMAFALVLFVNGTTLEANATEVQSVESEVENLDTAIIDIVNEGQQTNSQTRTFLSNCSIMVRNNSAGMLVEFMTNATQTASSIGVKDIKIQQRVWYGWKTVATASGAESYNTASFGCAVLYSNAQVGETYRISCVHYGTVDTYTEVDNETEGIVFTY